MDKKIISINLHLAINPPYPDITRGLPINLRPSKGAIIFNWEGGRLFLIAGPHLGGHSHVHLSSIKAMDDIGVVTDTIWGRCNSKFGGQYLCSWFL